MKLLVLFAAIIGFANASPSHGYTRTIINGPSGTIVQETPGAHILKSFLSSKVYAPTFTGAVSVPGPIVAEAVPHIAAPFVETPVVHSVFPEPIVPAPVVPLPAPVVQNAFLHHPLAVPYVLPGSAPVPFSPFGDSRVVPVPPFVEPAVPFSPPVPGFPFPAPVPVVDTRFFPHNPLYVERVVHPAPFVPAPVPVPVPAIDVHPVKTFPEIVFGKYPPAVPPTEYGL